MSAALIAALRKRCQAQPGATVAALDGSFTILDGFLDSFARFYPEESPPVLMLRCKDEERERLAANSSSIRVSTRMSWDTTGWKWTDIDLDGSMLLETLVQLVEHSYRIAYGGLYDYAKERIALLTRDLPPQELLPEPIKSHGLQRKQVEVQKLLSPAILLKTTRTPEKKLALGQSKLGGCPDLPSGVPWPTYRDGRSLSFLAQINLGELPADAVAKRLPPTGMLYFFSVFGWQEDGDSDPRLPLGEYADDWTRVLYHAVDAAQLTRTKPPANTKGFTAARVEPIAIPCLPVSAKEPEVAVLKWSKGVAEKYESLVRDFKAVIGHRLDNPPRNLVLGYADFEQQFVKTVAKDDMRLLLQLASDDAADMMWGDGGYVYFWAGKTDLQRGNFEKILTDLQGG